MHQQKKFGQLEGKIAYLYTLKNNRGMELSVTNYGGTVTSLKVVRANGKLHDVVLGFDNLEDYLLSQHYIGALVGRYANRIAGGRFSIADRKYTLAQNNGSNHLHGGQRGFDKVLWDAILVDDAESTGVQLSYLSRDGEEGYPGNLRVQVTYWLNENNELKIDYFAETDATTIVCLTHHGYFNLSRGSTIKGHTLQLAADSFTPVDSGLIPTGEIRSVEGTICDLRETKCLGSLLDAKGADLLDGGFDHNFILPGTSDLPCATLFAEDSGLKMEMFTSEPAVQLYTGNYLGTDAAGVSKIFPQYGGLCLEAQHYPNSPNAESFPTVLLHPGENYRQKTRYRFSAH
jgi:aldose 1-epimerase